MPSLYHIMSQILHVAEVLFSHIYSQIAVCRSWWTQAADSMWKQYRLVAYQIEVCYTNEWWSFEMIANRSPLINEQNEQWCLQNTRTFMSTGLVMLHLCFLYRVMFYHWTCNMYLFYIFNFVLKVLFHYSE